MKFWLLKTKPKVEESKIHNRVPTVWVCWTECSWGWISEMIHWKEGHTVSHQRETRKENNFCLAFLGPGSVCEWQRVRIWTRIQWSLKPRLFPNYPNKCPNSSLLLAGSQASLSCSSVIVVSTAGNCVGAGGQGPSSNVLDVKAETAGTIPDEPVITVREVDIP